MESNCPRIRSSTFNLQIHICVNQCLQAITSTADRGLINRKLQTT
jgi:hypothetical protein